MLKAQSKRFKSQHLHLQCIAGKKQNQEGQGRVLFYYYVIIIIRILIPH